MTRLGLIRTARVSHGAMAAMLLATLAAQPARAQGFAGTGTVTFGSATIAPSGAHGQTVTISNASPVTTINWAPTDTAVSAAPVDFLPATETVSFQGQPSANQPYTVLNRILPADPTRTVAFNGAVTSGADVRVWFYSPGGLLVGSTGTFNVGGLVLTTADPVADVSGNFMSTFDRFSLAAAPGVTSGVTIAPGAQIRVDNSGTGFPLNGAYMVAFGQKIDQGGALNVLGKTALVAAESADFAIDTTGLFSISVTAGTTVASNTFVHTGTTGGSDSAANSDTLARRVYMVAVPKNNAITMAISSGGSIGFDIAGAAQQDGNAVVLSAGSNINDTGTGAGNPIVSGPAGSGAASLTVDGALFTSRTYAASTGSLAVGDGAGAVAFRADALLRAPSASLTSSGAGIVVDGDLRLDASASGPGTSAGSVTLVANGGSVSVGGAAGALGVGGDLQVLADDEFGAQGGNAGITVGGGALTVAGGTTISARGTWNGSGAINGGGVETRGGIAGLTVNSGGQAIIGGTLQVNAGANATNAGAVYDPAAGLPNAGIDATAGSASLTVSGTGAAATASGFTIRADATGGTDNNLTTAGSANGGQASALASGGGTISTTSTSGSVFTSAQATGGADAGADTLVGGNAFGGTARVAADAGSIVTFSADGVSAIASAFGGNGGGGAGNGGAARAGIAAIEARNGGAILSNFSGSTAPVDGGPSAIADAVGGTAVGSGAGGDATGGIAAFTANGSTIAFDRGNDVTVRATASGGGGANFGGGRAVGGTAEITASGGLLTVGNALVAMATDAAGGTDSGSGNGGDAIAGTVRVQTSKGAVIAFSGANSSAGSGTYSASAVGGNAIVSGTGGNATGGNVLVSNLPDGGGLGIDQNNFGLRIDTSATSGSGSSGSGAIDSAGGALVAVSTDIAIRVPITLVGNTSLTLRSAGSIDISAGGQVVGFGDGAHLGLHADLNGTGTGTVTLANGALVLPGSGSTIDIYYNPASFGTPNDYSPGVNGGLLTAYQLVNNINQLQLVGSFLDQNFALGRDIDAAQTQSWNGGAGFVPIGSDDLTSPFTGNFDGLGHVVSRLFINRPAARNTGLFATVGNGAGAAISIRNIGLIDADVTGGGSTISSTGGLIGYVLPGSNQVLVDNAFVTGKVSAGWDAGGLLGESDNPNFILSNSHSDAAVTVNGGSFAGGLVGYLLAGNVIQSWATGPVSMLGDGGRNLGGLIGDAEAGTTVTRSYATGAVLGGTNLRRAGGLIGYNLASVSQSYATGSVTVGAGGTRVGGLIGLNDVGSGPLAASYASGLVTAPGSPSVGGLVGENNASILGGYWDTFSTGQASAFGVNAAVSPIVFAVTSDPAQAAAGNYAFNPAAYSLLTAGGSWQFFQRTIGGSRPIGTWELPRARFGEALIGSAHQVELIDFAPAVSYSLQHDIAMGGTTDLADVWGGFGFMPIGYGGTSFSGTLAGNGRVLSALTVTNNGSTLNGGLFAVNAGTIQDLGLAGASINGEFGAAGAIAGVNFGTIVDSFATGAVQGTGGIAGGLAGANDGTIRQSYADVAVQRGSTGTVGGLVGINATQGTIDQSYARGTVTGGTTAGLAGSNSGTVTASYWDSERSGQALGCGGQPCAGAGGLSTAQTLQAASFSAFAADIDTLGGQALPWRIYQGQTTPLLKRFLSPVVIRANDATLVYNAQVPTVGYTSYGAQPGHVGGTATFTGIDANAGSHSVFYGGGLFSDQTGHDIVTATTPGTILINRAPLALNATIDSRTYNATAGSALSVGVVGLQGSDFVSSLSQSFDSANVGSRTLSVNAGYVINDGNGGNNYTVTPQTAGGSISAAPLTLSAGTDSRVYNATTGSSISVGVAGLQGSDTVTGLGQSFDSANAGNRTLSVNNGFTINDGNGGANYAVTRQSAAGSITPAPLTLSAGTDSRVYDATTGSGISVGIAGLQGSDTVTGLGQSFDSANAGNRTLAVNNGFTINDGNGGANYSVTRQTAAGSITPATLTLGAVTDSRAYNATTGSNLPVTVSGLRGNDSVTTFGQSFDSANAGSRTLLVNGGYQIVDGNGGANYTVTTLSATGAITAAPLVLSAASDSRVYDATTVSNVAVGVTGLQGNDTIVNLSQAFDSVNAGSRTLAVGNGFTINDGNGGANYSVTRQAAAGSISPAPLLLSAVSQSRTYDTTSASSLSVAVSGLRGADSVSNLSQAFDSANAGSRTLTVNGGFTVNDGNGGANYAVTRQAAGGLITPAPVSVTYTANPASGIYGDAPPALTGTVAASGLLGNDTLAGVTIGSAAFATTATAASGVGSHAVTGSGLVANSGNYQFSFLQAPGNAVAFTIVPRPITVTADPQARDQGNANPVLTFAVVGAAQDEGGNLPGLVNGDQLTGALATEATVTSPAGSYAITRGTLAASANYQVSYVGNLLVVNQGNGPILQAGGTVLGNLPSQSAGGGNEDGGRDPNDPGLTEEEKRELAAVTNGLAPPTITQSLINDQTINRPAPVNTPVTSNGNPSQWTSPQPSGASQ